MLRLLLCAVVIAVAVAIPFETTDKATELATEHGALREWGLDKFCDPTVKESAGYFNVTTATKEYFYLYYEARNNASNAPVVLWMTGGPGCSSELAMLVENGPCSVTNASTPTTVPNKFSWNTNANLLYIDQPAGTGFSYGKPSDYDHNEAEVGLDMMHFLEAFFLAHPELDGRELYVTGESYGGHYVPATASAVFNANQQGSSKVKFNLAGLAVGNGLVAPEIQYGYYADMAYNNSYKQLIKKPAYETMKAASKVCIAAIHACQKVESTCLVALELCQLSQVAPVQAEGVNLYDVTQPCSHPPLCYDFDAESRFLNLEATKKALGVGTRKWESCNMVVNQMFHKDWMQTMAMDLPPMLKAGVRVLIYAGDLDYICNWMGNKAWTLDLDWEKKDAFNAQGDHDWKIGSEATGQARTVDNFTFLRVYEAGHMVPMNKPEAALNMLDTFLQNKPFY